MNRGDRREIIFHDNFDRELILRPLGEPWHKVNFQIHRRRNVRCEFHPGMRRPMCTYNQS